MTDFEIFEQAFRGSVSGAQGICEGCNKRFYDAWNSYDGEWHDTDLPLLEKDKDAIGINHSIGCIVIAGTEYVDGCGCWHKKAEDVISLLNSNSFAIADYLNLRKKQAVEQSSRMPEIFETCEPAQKES